MAPCPWHPAAAVSADRGERSGLGPRGHDDEESGVDRVVYGVAQRLARVPEAKSIEDDPISVYCNTYGIPVIAES